MRPITGPYRLEGQPKTLGSKLLKSNAIRLGLVVHHDGNSRALPRGDGIMFEIEGLAGSLALHRIKNVTPRRADRLVRRIPVHLRLVGCVRGLCLGELLLKPPVVRNQAPCERLARHFARRAKRRLVDRDENQRVAKAPLRGAAAHKCLRHRVGRGRLRGALAGMRRRRTENDERQRGRFINRDRIVRHGMHAVESALVHRIVPQHLCDPRSTATASTPPKPRPAGPNQAYKRARTSPLLSFLSQSYLAIGAGALGPNSGMNRLKCRFTVP
jgi:hypothetical protein